MPIHRCWMEVLKVLRVTRAFFDKGGKAGLRVCLPGAKMVTSMASTPCIHTQVRGFIVMSLEASIRLLASSRLPPKTPKSVLPCQ